MSMSPWPPRVQRPVGRHRRRGEPRRSGAGGSVGRRVKAPLANRIIPIIADDYVVKPDANSEDPKARMASGFLKVTPAHDPNDWDIGQRHGLEAINVWPDGASTRTMVGATPRAWNPKPKCCWDWIDLTLEINSSKFSGNEDFWRMSGPTSTRLGTPTDPTLPSSRACPTSGTSGSATTDWLEKPSVRCSLNNAPNQAQAATVTRPLQPREMRPCVPSQPVREDVRIVAR